MIRSWMRSIAAIAVGLFVAMVLIIAIESVSGIFHPFPPGADTNDPEVVKAHVAKYPNWILAIVVVGWGGIVFLGTWVATRLGAGRHPAHGFVVGSLLLLAVGFNMYLLPYPLWFELGNVIVFPLAIFRAVKLGMHRL